MRGRDNAACFKTKARIKLARKVLTPRLKKKKKRLTSRRCRHSDVMTCFTTTLRRPYKAILLVGMEGKKAGGAGGRSQNNCYSRLEPEF